MMTLLTVLGKPSEAVERNIAALVRSVCTRAEEANLGMKVNIVVDPDAENLKIEESRLLPTVFDNLLRNAAKYAGPTALIEVHVSLDDGYIQVLVSDNGPGISESIRDRLFEKGVSTSGGGLGLYLSREVATSMGGSIELVEPEEGEGATFKIRLPKAI
jgi:signal transduction histidine kinase